MTFNFSHKRYWKHTLEWKVSLFNSNGAESVISWLLRLAIVESLFVVSDITPNKFNRLYWRGIDGLIQTSIPSSLFDTSHNCLANIQCIVFLKR